MQRAPPAHACQGLTPGPKGSLCLSRAVTSLQASQKECRLAVAGAIGGDRSWQVELLQPGSRALGRLRNQERLP